MGPKRKATLRAKREARRSEAERQLTALRAGGARCAACVHCRFHPYDRFAIICNLGSDFHGHEIVKPDGLCVLFDTPESPSCP